MAALTDRTHDPKLRSWVTSANDAGTDFPIQNLPFGVFRTRGSAPRLGVAIGNRILDVPACVRAGLLSRENPAAAHADDDTLNGLMSLGREGARAARAALVDLLVESNRSASAKSGEITVAQQDAELLLPAQIGDYSDFYASIHHATNVGSMFRPDNPLLPNYKYVPIGYHGRASSIVASGTGVRRPRGQLRDDASAPPAYAASRRLDYEMEIGAFVARGNALGAVIPIARALDEVWGICLVNDWSARDIQTWEYQPLGPFLAKSFATSISPWVVTLEALAPFRAAAVRPAEDPAPLPYLSDATDKEQGALDVTVEVYLRTAAMKSAGTAPMLVSRGGFREMYWTMGQMLAHHASNGCNLRPGDLIASGTISGPTKESRGCLLERTWRGTEPLTLPSGETRTFLEDGDDVTMRGYAEREGFRRIGLGECTGTVLPAA